MDGQMNITYIQIIILNIKYTHKHYPGILNILFIMKATISPLNSIR